MADGAENSRAGRRHDLAGAHVEDERGTTVRRLTAGARAVERGSESSLGGRLQEAARRKACGSSNPRTPESVPK